jgi:hypothetical protein
MSAVRTINRVDLDRYVLLEEEIAELRGTANAKAKELATLHAEVEAYVIAKAGPERKMKRCGFELVIQKVKRSVSWKSELIARLGASLAKTLENSAGTKDQLEVKKL